MTAEWMTRGLCQHPAHRPLYADQPPGHMSQRQQTRQAKNVCNQCPVKTACLTWALDVEHEAPKGGRDPKERDQAARQSSSDP